MHSTEEQMKLLVIAKQAGLASYSPYSKFRVGAALQTKNGKVYTGCNVENRSYGSTICAEQVAITKAVSEGEREFVMIAIVGLDYEKPLPPCGMCRQIMSEFSKDLEIVMSDAHFNHLLVAKMGDVLPFDSLDDLREDCPS